MRSLTVDSAVYNDGFTKKLYSSEIRAQNVKIADINIEKNLTKLSTCGILYVRMFYNLCSKYSQEKK